MPVGSCIWGTICKYENGTPKAARNAFDIWKVWNPVCWYGNKTFKLVLWSILSRILLQKNQTFLIQIGWVIFLHHIWSKFSWVYDVITWLICIFQKLEYLWNEKRYLKIVNGIFLLTQVLNSWLLAISI